MFTGLGIVTTLTVVGSTCLVPSIVFSKYIMRWPSIFNLPSSSQSNNSAPDDDHETNTSNTTIGSLTAIKTLGARSQMNIQQSGGPDNIAPLLMSQLSLFGPNIPGSRLFSKFYSMLSRWNFYLTGRVFVDQLSEIWFPHLVQFGEVGLLQSRTCWLDDVVESFANRHHHEEGQRPFNVVILGAGYDTRSYRLDAILKNNNAKLYEVDAAGSQENKKRALDKAGVDSSHVSFVSCDFETSDWMDILQSKSDFDKRVPSLFVWEGVSYYLDHEVVISTISKISICGKGSCIAFDYFDESCLNDAIRKSSESIGEPLKFGIDDVEHFVKYCNMQSLSSDMEGSSNSGATVLNLQVLDHLRCKELKERYIAQCNGRYIGYLSEFGGFLLLGS